MYVWLELFFSMYGTLHAFLLVTEIKGEIQSLNNKASFIHLLLLALFFITVNNFEIVNTNHLFLASEASSGFR